MNRTVKNRNVPNVKPVDKVRLSEKHTRWKFAAVILLLVIAMIAFSYGMVSCFSGETGWRTIEVSSSAETNCSSEFVFQYHIGASGISAAAENRELTSLYTDATVKAYQLFNTDEHVADSKNLFYINRHPNEEMEVDEVLYQAFALLEKSQNRNLYLAPVYVEYQNLFFCRDDSEAANFDPYQNEDMRAYVAEVAAYAASAENVNLELLGNNRIILHVSDEYQKYAQDNAITNYIDFYWMKNAFIIDYLADVITAHGYTAGSLSSYDGFTRNLDDSGKTYALNLYERNAQTVYPVAIMQYSQARSIVSLRNYRMNNLDLYRFYEWADGEIRSPYVDIADGLCKTAVNDLTAYSDEAGCAEILSYMMPVYIAEEFDEEQIKAWAQKKIYTVYCQEGVICYNDSSLILTDLYDKDGIRYSTKLTQ